MVKMGMELRIRLQKTCMLGLNDKGVGYGEEGLGSKLCYHG
jgi:hypothetical protein